jgi:hypothetical protein
MGREVLHGQEVLGRQPDDVSRRAGRDGGEGHA